MLQGIIEGLGLDWPACADKPVRVYERADTVHLGSRCRGLQPGVPPARETYYTLAEFDESCLARCLSCARNDDIFDAVRYKGRLLRSVVRTAATIRYVMGLVDTETPAAGDENLWRWAAVELQLMAPSYQAYAADADSVLREARARAEELTAVLDGLDHRDELGCMARRQQVTLSPEERTDPETEAEFARWASTRPTLFVPDPAFAEHYRRWDSHGAAAQPSQLCAVRARLPDAAVTDFTRRLAHQRDEPRFTPPLPSHLCAVRGPGSHIPLRRPESGPDSSPGAVLGDLFWPDGRWTFVVHEADVVELLSTLVAGAAGWELRTCDGASLMAATVATGLYESGVGIGDAMTLAVAATAPERLRS